MYGKPTSIGYTIEVVDIPIRKNELRIYKSTVKINLKLTYQNPPTPKGGKFIFTIPISALTPYGVSINTIKRMIDSVSSSQCNNNDILYYFDKGLIIITINYNPTISKIPITLDISYKTPVNIPIFVDKKTVLSVFENRHKSQFERYFVIPIYDEIENDSITYNIILPAGWKVDYGRHRTKYHLPHSTEIIAMNCIEKKIHAVRRYKVNKFKSKRRPCFKHVVLFVEPKDLYYEDKFKNTPFYHNWEFNKNNRSVWNLIIYKKQLQHYMHNNGGIKELTFGFVMCAGSKNKMIVILSHILLIASILLTLPTLFVVFFTGNTTNYSYNIFTDVGLLTAIFSYFFSYISAKNNGLILCVAPETIESNIGLSLSLVLAMLIVGALIGIGAPSWGVKICAGGLLIPILMIIIVHRLSIMLKDRLNTCRE